MNSKRFILASCAVVLLLTLIYICSKIDWEEDLITLKTNVVPLRTDVTSWRAEIASLETDVASLDTEMVAIRKKHKRQKHIFFLRTHKCGSTTIYSIFLRFGYINNLTFVLPANPDGVTISSTPFQRGKGFFLPPPAGEKYDILCHHTIYNRVELSKVLPKDTMYIGLVREPLARFVSAFVYYTHVSKKQYLKNIRGKNLVSAMSRYLKNPSYYEPENEREWSHTNNGMASDFGFPVADMKNITKAKIERFIKKLDAEFDLVIVLEYLDESLVLMKRILRWTLKDILYLRPANVAVTNTTRILAALTEEDRRRHRQWEALDFALYNHFVKKLKDAIQGQDPSFQKEVEDFRKARDAVVEFCKNHGDFKKLVYTTKDSYTLKIRPLDCRMINTMGSSVTRLIKSKKKYPRVTTINNPGN